MSDKELKVQVLRPFGPPIIKVKIPNEIIVKINDYSELVFNDEKKLKELDHGDQLAGNVTQEFLLEEKFATDSGWLKFLSLVSSHVIKSFLNKDLKNLNITSTWIVRQFQNEYNPVHNHTGCQVSAVLYLKIPKDIKGRRKMPSKESRQDNDGDINFIYSSDSQRPGDVLNRGITQFVPLPGMLAIFPSYLLHTVYPFIGEGERRSIAFNACYTIKSKEGQYVAGDTSEFNPYETFYGYEKPK